MNTIETIEPCPVCQNPDTTIEHGVIGELGYTVHIEHCPECGTHVPIVCYPCPLCVSARMEVPSLTRKELFELSDARLSALQSSLGKFLDTPKEQEAKLLNQAINGEKERREPKYGF